MDDWFLDSLAATMLNDVDAKDLCTLRLYLYDMLAFFSQFCLAAG